MRSCGRSGEAWEIWRDARTLTMREKAHCSSSSCGLSPIIFSKTEPPPSARVNIFFISPVFAPSVTACTGRQSSETSERRRKEGRRRGDLRRRHGESWGDRAPGCRSSSAK